MITKAQLQEWEKQNAKDMDQFRKDQEHLNKYETVKKDGVRAYFEKLRAKYFNFQSEQNDKLNRMLLYTQIQSQIQNYPKIMNTYLTYNTSAIILFAVCLFAPKKVISKIIISLVAYGLKKNIADGIFTYYMVESMALSNNMTEKQQELRNILQFYYMHKKFTNKMMTEEEQIKGQQLLADIRKMNEKYKNYKKVESLL